MEGIGFKSTTNFQGIKVFHSFADTRVAFSFIVVVPCSKIPKVVQQPVAVSTVVGIDYLVGVPV